MRNLYVPLLCHRIMSNKGLNHWIKKWQFILMRANVLSKYKLKSGIY